MPIIFIDDGFGTNAIDFDGSTGYLARGSDLTGNADSSTGIFSCWFRLDGSNGSAMSFLESNGSGIGIRRLADNTITIEVTSVAGTETFRFGTVATFTSATTWHHLLMSWNTNFSSGNKLNHLYIDDSLDLQILADSIAFNINYTQSNYFISSGNGPDKFFNGCIAELYFAPGQFLDFSNSSNRLKFRGANGKPVFLGTDGSLPTSTAPLIYLKNPAATAGVNSGTGGNFTSNGTVAVGSTSPSA